MLVEKVKEKTGYTDLESLFDWEIAHGGCGARFSRWLWMELRLSVQGRSSFLRSGFW